MTQLVFYVLHFDRPLGAARHYGGSTLLSRFDQRMREHASGSGAAITRRLRELRIGFWAAPITFIADRPEERRIKRSKHLKHLCPICSPHIVPLREPTRHHLLTEPPAGARLPAAALVRVSLNPVEKARKNPATEG